MDQLNGKCLCGKSQYKIAAEPEFQFLCYCNNCRVVNSGHLCGMMFDQSHLTPATDTQIYSYQGGSGNDIELHFCPVCSTNLYAYPREYEGKVVIRANTLINADFKPQKNLFSESAFAWDKPTSTD